GTAGGANPASKTVSVANTGGQTLTYTASDDASWLSLSPTSGTAPKDISASIDTTGLSAGTYTATITITAPGATGSPKTIPVTLPCDAPPPPVLSFPPSRLTVSGTAGAANSASKTVSVANTGGQTLTYTASDDASWLSLSPTSGTAPKDITA